MILKETVVSMAAATIVFQPGSCTIQMHFNSSGEVKILETEQEILDLQEFGDGRIVVLTSDRNLSVLEMDSLSVTSSK